MGTGFVDREAEKAEHWMVFLVISAIGIHVFSKCAIMNVDMIAFAIFVAMCFSACMVFSAAKDILSSLHSRSRVAYETLKMNMETPRNFEIRPSAFKNGTKFSKYATSTYIENVRNSL